MTTTGYARELRVDQPKWLRGNATYQEGAIVLDASAAERYAPLSEQSAHFALAAIQRPEDAVAFVRRYGLLRHGPGSEELRERFTEWEVEASKMRAILGLYMHLTRAVNGDAVSLDDLRAWQQGVRYLEPVADDAHLLYQVSKWVAWALSVGLTGTEERVDSQVDWGTGPDGAPGRPDHFLLNVQPPDLLGLIYHSAAMDITYRVPLGSCEECSRFYVIEDQRQRFCTPTCAGRSRRRRWRQKQEGQP